MIEVRNLKKHFESGFFRKRLLKAVDGVSFGIHEGETVGLVGESGCGKTTLGKLIARIISPTAGVVMFRGTNIVELNKKEFRSIRPRIQMVFQNPDLALNPRMRIEESLAEPFRLHSKCGERERKKRVRELLNMVGLHKEHLKRYPYELSGGQVQRVVLARILAVSPEFIVLDEPTSSLDVSVQAQILKLLKKFQSRFHLTYLFISHDLDIVRFVSDRIIVMYLGKFVEVGDVEQIFNRATHPYTQALLSAILNPIQPQKEEKTMLKSEIPTSTDPPPGCRFHPRCPYSRPLCEVEKPKLIESETQHFVACHLIDRSIGRNEHG